MHDKLKILDIEEKTNSFRVHFEVPGHHYNQDFPKRLAHDFPYNDKFLDDVSLNGETVKRFEEYLVDNYIKDEESKKQRDNCCKKIENVKSNVKGREHSV
jgi:hypothetical protein